MPSCPWEVVNIQVTRQNRLGSLAKSCVALLLNTFSEGAIQGSTEMQGNPSKCMYPCIGILAHSSFQKLKKMLLDLFPRLQLPFLHKAEGEEPMSDAHPIDYCAHDF